MVCLPSLPKQRKGIQGNDAPEEKLSLSLLCFYSGNFCCVFFLFFCRKEKVRAFFITKTNASIDPDAYFHQYMQRDLVTLALRDSVKGKERERK